LLCICSVIALHLPSTLTYQTIYCLVRHLILGLLHLLWSPDSCHHPSFRYSVHHTSPYPYFVRSSYSIPQVHTRRYSTALTTTTESPLDLSPAYTTVELFPVSDQSLRPAPSSGPLSLVPPPTLSTIDFRLSAIDPSMTLSTTLLSSRRQAFPTISFACFSPLLSPSDSTPTLPLRR
jgi:hypothetical protein